MTINLLPRLSSIIVEKNLQKYAELISLGNSLPNTFDLRSAKFAASGGRKISIEGLEQLKIDITAIAKKHGFPEKGTTKTRSKFDFELSIFLATHEFFNTGEALREDTWSFVSTILTPEIVIWRFKLKPNTETGKFDSIRFKGGIRNAYQRLWIRGNIFDRGIDHEARWELLDILTEDAMVQITERPSISTNKLVAQSIAEAWLTVIRKTGINEVSSEQVMRNAIILIRLESEIIDLSKLEKADLRKLLNKHFLRAARS